MGAALDGGLDAATARWLVSAEGLADVANVTDDLDAGRDELAVATRLARDGIPPGRVGAVVAAAVARRRARADWPDADRLLFTRAALEQASHPTVAAWRAARFDDAEVWDLCAGVGGDALELAARARRFTAVELDPARATLLEHNARQRDLDLDVVVGDALEVVVPPSALVHADPARRHDGRRVRWLRDHLPPVPAVFERCAAAPGVAVVVSPAVDLGDVDLPADVEVEFLQLGGRLVEAVLWAGRLRGGDATATATLLPSGERRSRTGPRPPRLAVGGIGSHLVEVAPAAIRARLHDDIGAEIGAHRIASHRALLSTDTAPPVSPWYRARPVLASLPARPKAVRAWLRETEPDAVEIVLHGVEGDQGGWWRDLGRPPRGPEGVRVELVRLDDGARAIITAASA